MQFIIDEGLPIIDDMIPGVKPPVALIGVAEKGYTTLVIKAETDGGHSSMPSLQSRFLSKFFKLKFSIGIVAEAIRKIETTPAPVFMEYARATMEYLAPDMNLLNRVAVSNFWMFEPMIRK